MTGLGWRLTRGNEVIQRGARLDEGAPGSGLGLSIVDELVRAYGGSMELAASSMGGLRGRTRLAARRGSTTPLGQGASDCGEALPIAAG